MEGGGKGALFHRIPGHPTHLLQALRMSQQLVNGLAEALFIVPRNYDSGFTIDDILFGPPGIGDNDRQT